MSNDTNEVQRAAARLAGLRSHGRTPDPETDACARRALATARIDREIRRASATASPLLNDVQAGHLVGLLLGNCGVGAESIGWLETAAREAVRNAQGGAE